MLRNPALRAAYDRDLGLPAPPRRAADHRPRSRRPHRAGAAGSGDRSRPPAVPRGAGRAPREIAAESKVGGAHLEYIEADRFDRLPAPVYLRGFLQEYARVVGLDPRATAESYLARMPRR